MGLLHESRMREYITVAHKEGGGGGAIAQSVESGEEVPDSIPAAVAHSLLVASVSV